MSSIRKEIHWQDRMEARVAAGVLVLVALSVAAVVLTATRVATRSAVARTSDNLEAARTAFYRLVDDRAAVAAQQTRLITELPVFRSMMLSPAVASDVATLTEMAESYRATLNAQFAIVSTPTGTPMATPGWQPNLTMPDTLIAAIRGAAAGQSRRDIVPIDGRLVLITSEPAKFTEAEVIGVVTFGFVLDDRVAQDLARITRAEINLVTGNRLAGSSLSPNEQKQIAALVAAGNLASADAISSEIRRIGDRQFIGGAFPLFPDHASQAGHLVLLQDWAPTQKFLDELRLSLVLAGIGGFVIALGGGLLFSRRMSQPLMDIAAAARDIAAGDWSRIVPGARQRRSDNHGDGVQRHDTQPAQSGRAVERLVPALRDGHAVGARRHRFDGRGANITFWNRSAESTFGYTEQRSARSPDRESDWRVRSRGVDGRAPEPCDRRSHVRTHHRSHRHAQGRRPVPLRVLPRGAAQRGRHGLYGGRARRDGAQAVAGSRSSSATSSCARRRRWKPSAGSQVAWRTTSTTCSWRSTATRKCSRRTCRPATSGEATRKRF